MSKDNNNKLGVHKNQKEISNKMSNIYLFEARKYLEENNNKVKIINL